MWGTHGYWCKWIVDLGSHASTTMWSLIDRKIASYAAHLHTFILIPCFSYGSLIHSDIMCLQLGRCTDNICWDRNIWTSMYRHPQTLMMYWLLVSIFYFILRGVGGGWRGRHKFYFYVSTILLWWSSSSILSDILNFSLFHVLVVLAARLWH